MESSEQQGTRTCAAVRKNTAALKITCRAGAGAECKAEQAASQLVQRVHAPAVGTAASEARSMAAAVAVALGRRRRRSERGGSDKALCRRVHMALTAAQTAVRGAKEGCAGRDRTGAGWGGCFEHDAHVFQLQTARPWYRQPLKVPWWGLPPVRSQTHLWRSLFEAHTTSLASIHPYKHLPICKPARAPPQPASSRAQRGRPRSVGATCCRCAFYSTLQCNSASVPHVNKRIKNQGLTMAASGCFNRASSHISAAQVHAGPSLAALHRM